MSDRMFEHAVRDWLEAGSDQTPPAAIDAVLLAVKTTPQERDLRIPRRFTPLTNTMRLAAGIAIVAVLGVGALLYLNRGPTIGPPLATPTIVPTTLSTPTSTQTGIDPTNWIAYTSERYGFDIKRPPDWAETPSDRVWTLPEAADFLSTGTEDFYFERVDGQGVRVSAWSVAVESGTSLETWLQGYCAAAAAPCPGVLDAGVPVTTLDGHEGVSLAGPAENSRAYILVSDRVYSVTAWRPDTDPSVLEFGGGRKLVEAFVSTLQLRPDGPAPVAAPPALTESFTSERYGYSIDFPGEFWTATAAGELWVPGVEQDLWSDTFLPPSTFNGFRAASAPIPDGVTVDDWIAQNVIGVGPRGECGPARSTLGDITIDGQVGKVRISCEEVEATVIVDGRVYLFTLFLDAGEPYSTAGGRALFEAMMASVRLTPETAEVAPSPAAS